MGNLFAKAHAGVNLTPAERATLKLVQGFVLAGLVAALPIVLDAFGHRSVVWSEVLNTALAAFTTAALAAGLKYLKAHLDTPLDETVALTPKGQAAVADAQAQTPAQAA